MKKVPTSGVFSRDRRKRKALERGDDFFCSLIENSLDILTVLNHKATILYINPAVKQILGYEPESVIGRPIFDFIHPQDFPRILDSFNKIVKDQAPEQFLELCVRHNDGSWRICEGLGKNLLDDPSLEGIVINARDITERKKMQDILRDREAKYRMLAENVSDIIWVRDMNLRLIYISPSIHLMRGYTVEEAMAQGLDQILSPSSFKLALKVLGEEIAVEEMEEKDLNRSRTLELEHRCKDGSLVWAEVKTAFLRDSNGRAIGILGVSRDITERKKAEEALKEAYEKNKQVQGKLIQSSKMAAVGQLAAGISHELIQPLTGIKGLCQAIFINLEKKSPIRKGLKKVLEQVLRMERIVKNVCSFSSESGPLRQKLDINKPIEDALVLSASQLKRHNILVSKELDRQLPKIKADTTQLEQIFLNLISNARDAILSLESPKERRLFIRSGLSKDKKNIKITFEDTGCGIAKERLGTIFEPFFTTKSTEGGIGLGLSIVYRIIENHKGSIEVKSLEGKGTTFEIALPIS